MGDFALHNRKNSAYLRRNKPQSATNRKISAYFPFAGYLIKDRNSYLNGIFCKMGEPHFDASLRTVP